MRVVLDRTLKARPKGHIDKLDLLKIETFVLQRKIKKRMKEKP